MKHKKQKLEQLETLCAACRALGAEVRYCPEYGCFTAMVWNGWDWSYCEGPAQAVQQQIQRQTDFVNIS